MTPLSAANASAPSPPQRASPGIVTGPAELHQNRNPSARSWDQLDRVEKRHVAQRVGIAAVEHGDQDPPGHDSSERDLTGSQIRVPKAPHGPFEPGAEAREAPGGRRRNERPGHERPGGIGGEELLDAPLALPGNEEHRKPQGAAVPDGRRAVPVHFEALQQPVQRQERPGPGERAPLGERMRRAREPREGEDQHRRQQEQRRPGQVLPVQTRPEPSAHDQTRRHEAQGRAVLVEPRQMTRYLGGACNEPPQHSPDERHHRQRPVRPAAVAEAKQHAGRKKPRHAHHEAAQVHGVQHREPINRWPAGSSDTREELQRKARQQGEAPGLPRADPYQRGPF